MRRGTIHALIGPNGAGKTTCFNLLTKFLTPTRGHDPLQRRTTSRARSPRQIARRGIVRSFQISAVFPHLTVLENVRIALQRALGTSFHFWKPERTLDVLNDARAASCSTPVGLQRVRRRADRSSCPTAASARSRSPPRWRWNRKLMLLDEPTQGMGHEDVDRVTRADQGGRRRAAPC